MRAEDKGIPLAKQEIREEDVVAVVDVLRSERLALGDSTQRFETALAEYVGVRHAVAVNSGTSALHLIVRALEIGAGDEVITTPFTFVATSNAILFEHAVPVFVDIEPETLCIDPNKIETAITPRTKAILAVDVFGHPANWPALERIAASHNLALMEDSAEALGSALRGKRCGSFGRAGVFGFYPNKQITTGEGGMITTDDEKIARRCRSMANQGRGSGKEGSRHVRLGFNYRLSEIASALGGAQLSRIEQIVNVRRRLVDQYGERLRGVPGLKIPSTANGDVSWFVYVVRLSECCSQADRDTVLDGLRRRGIGCRNYFAPVHLEPFYRRLLGSSEGDLPVAEAVGARTIALPFYNELREDQIDFVCHALRRELEGVG